MSGAAMKTSSRQDELLARVAAFTQKDRESAPSDSELWRTAARMMARSLPAKARERLRKEMADTTDEFSKEDTPGHEFWMPYYIILELLVLDILADSPEAK